MRGQLYEACDKCRNDDEQAVCVDCHCCKRHCLCDAPRVLSAETARKLEVHLEQGAAEQ
jgi:hypothetical protein